MRKNRKMLKLLLKQTLSYNLQKMDLFSQEDQIIDKLRKLNLLLFL